PVVLTRDEVRAIVAELHGTPRLVATLAATELKSDPVMTPVRRQIQPVARYGSQGAPARDRAQPRSKGLGRAPIIRAIAGLVVLGVLGGCLPALRHDPVTEGEWPSYGNDIGGTRYSSLVQIDRGNIERLRVAWTYRTGEVGGASPAGFTAFEAT